MKLRWKHGAGLLLFVMVSVGLALYIAFTNGFAQRFLRRATIHAIEDRTGARVEMKRFHFYPWKLRVEIDGLTLHGLEAPGAEPLFHADHIAVEVRILSILHRRFSLSELTIDRPELAISIDRDGHSNLPPRKPRPKGKPWQETLFNLEIAKLELRDGRADIGNMRVPLAVNGRDFDFALHYSAGSPAAGPGVYLGSFDFHHVRLAAKKDIPFAFDMNGRFALHPDSFELNEFVLHLPNSEFNVRADVANFSRPHVTLHYRGRLSLLDVRTIMHSPHTPDGVADFSGHAHYAAGEWTAAGYYNAHDIATHMQWFHAGGMRTWGNFEVADRKLVVPNLRVTALDGSIAGRLEMAFHNLAFRTDTKLRGANLTRVLAALDNPSFPVNALHFAGSIDADCVNTWDRNFKHFSTRGETRWSPPAVLAPGLIPVTAKVDYQYSNDLHRVLLAPGSEMSTPRAHWTFDGPLGKAGSALEVNFHSGDLRDWDPFINVLLNRQDHPVGVAGMADWQGRILGRIEGPTFAGHVQAQNARYGKLYWDAIAGDMDYSPDDFHLRNAIVRRGRTSAQISLALELNGKWSFLPSNTWSLDARLDRSPTQDLQEVLETNYPVSGLLTGDFHGSGTRQQPSLDGSFVLEDITAKSVHFDRLSAQLHFAPDEIRLSNADLSRGTGRVKGNVTIERPTLNTQFDLTATGISLEQVREIQTPSVPIAGVLGFHLHGGGFLLAPTAEGQLQITNLGLGTEKEGNFRGQISSDGHVARLSIRSEAPQPTLDGQLSIGFDDDQPISGRLSLVHFDLDPFIVAGLHLSHITSHSIADGVFTISGALRQPDSIQIVADVSHISFDYELVHLTNDQDIRLTYRRNEVRVDQAHLHGPDTDLRVSGSARFDRDRPLRLAVLGRLDLRLLNGFLPGFEFQGTSDANISIAGTISSPRITGRASIHAASASYADFPVSLSRVNGDFVFDQSRFLFDRITAQSGGGQLTLSGNVVYGDGPLRYEVNATTPAIRIRYPTGLSWLAGGTLQLSGTTQASLLSGRVQVQRLLFSQGVDMASFFEQASETTAGPPSSSPFLRNLSFDVEGQAAPGAQIQWASAQIGVDGSVRLRGTWDRPILLGNIHLLGGQMAFRGNNFQLTRGDINFANPFRLDPVLNVEATATISQYQVTINFSGPASRLSVTYRSDPPLPDSDIIALLALGTPGESAGLRTQSASSQSYGATALLSEAISSGIGGRIEHLFGISQFRVDPFVAGTATESNAAARVTIQEQVARNLTLTYSTNAATTNQYQLIQVQYDVSRTMSVEFLRDINGTYGFDIRWVKHFK
jgi:translocation and assembly module TamB